MKARLDERGVIVQPGDMIARRFRLVRTEEYDIPGATRFVAYDTRLDQDVTVDIVSSVAPTAVVRAAHRAQVVRDRRLTRILAANSERHDGERLTYVVSERLAGVRLDELLGHVAFQPATAAAIVGGAAAILGVPLRSGTHHGMIRPQSVTVTTRGRVMLSGLGVEGELGSQARLIRGRTERADAIALARLFVTAVTAMDADAVTADDLPADLTDSARDLCEALLRGSGPLTLAQITAALGTGEAAALRALVAEAPTLWWSPTPEVADSVDVAAAEEVAAPGEEVEDDADASLEGAEEDRAVEESVVPSSARLRTRFGGAVDDIDEFHDIVAAQNVDSAPSVLEEIFERLHRRFPHSDPLADLAAAAHRRAQTVAPFNIGPLLVASLIVLLFVAVVIAASMITQPIDAPLDGYDNPSQTYPEYTFGQTPPPAPEG